LFVDAINYIGRPSSIISLDEYLILLRNKLLHLLVSWKAVGYLNLVVARPSNVEHVSLRLNSFLEDFVPDVLKLAQVAYE